MGNIMKNIDELEYQQASQDWRHRDSLTWQITAVIVVVGSVIIAAFNLHDDVKYGTRIWLFLFSFAIVFCLSLALSQNLYLQKRSRDIIMNLNPNTKRFGFTKIGSGLLLVLSWMVCALLGVLCVLAIFDNL